VLLEEEDDDQGPEKPADWLLLLEVLLPWNCCTKGSLWLVVTGSSVRFCSEAIQCGSASPAPAGSTWPDVTMAGSYERSHDVDRLNVWFCWSGSPLDLCCCVLLLCCGC